MIRFWNTCTGTNFHTPNEMHSLYMEFYWLVIVFQYSRKNRDLLWEYLNFSKINIITTPREIRKARYRIIQNRKMLKPVLRIRDGYPGSWFFTHPGSRIPDQKHQEKRGVKKKFLWYIFFCSHKFHKIVNYFIIEMAKKKIWPSFQRIKELLPKNLSLSSKNMGLGSRIRDPRFGIRNKPIPDPGSGSRGQKGNDSRIPDPDPHGPAFNER